MYQNGFPTVKEQIGVQLISPLVIGIKYYISFYVSVAYNSIQENIATNKIGALLTTYQYRDSIGQISLNNFAHVYTDSIILDTLNWVKISGSFIADSVYQYLVIGAFFDNSHTDTLHLPFQQFSQVSYYYLDDVCLSQDSIECISSDGIMTIRNRTNVEVYPNIINNKCCITMQDEALDFIQLTSVLGNIIYSEKTFANTSSYSFDCTFITSGIYLLHIKTNKNSNLIRKIIINH